MVLWPPTEHVLPNLRPVSQGKPNRSETGPHCDPVGSDCATCRDVRTVDGDEVLLGRETEVFFLYRKNLFSDLRLERRRGSSDWKGISPSTVRKCKVRTESVRCLLHSTDLPKTTITLSDYRITFKCKFYVERKDILLYRRWLSPLLMYWIFVRYPQTFFRGPSKSTKPGKAMCRVSGEGREVIKIKNRFSNDSYNLRECLYINEGNRRKAERTNFRYTL